MTDLGAAQSVLELLQELGRFLVRLDDESLAIALLPSLGAQIGELNAIQASDAPQNDFWALKHGEGEALRLTVCTLDALQLV